MRFLLRLLAVLIATLAASAASAAEIKVMISAGFFNVYKELGPAFEKASGHTLVTTRGPSLGDSPDAIPTRLARGEHADVLIMDGHGTDILEARGLIASRTPLAESFIGMVVRASRSRTSVRSRRCARRCSPRSPSPIRTHRAARICRPSDSRSSASRTRSPAGRARCAVHHRASRWRRSSRAARRRSASSRSPS